MGFCGGRFKRLWGDKNADTEKESVLDQTRQADRERED